MKYLIQHLVHMTLALEDFVSKVVVLLKLSCEYAILALAYLALLLMIAMPMGYLMTVVLFWNTMGDWGSEMWFYSMSTLMELSFSIFMVFCLMGTTECSKEKYLLVKKMCMVMTFMFHLVYLLVFFKTYILLLYSMNFLVLWVRDDHDKPLLFMFSPMVLCSMFFSMLWPMLSGDWQEFNSWSKGKKSWDSYGMDLYGMYSFSLLLHFMLLMAFNVVGFLYI